MAFFRNDTVNLLNLHYGVHSLALRARTRIFESRNGEGIPSVTQRE